MYDFDRKIFFSAFGNRTPHRTPLSYRARRIRNASRGPREPDEPDNFFHFFVFFFFFSLSKRGEKKNTIKNFNDFT